MADNRALLSAAAEVRTAIESIEAVDLPVVPELSTEPGKELATALTSSLEQFQESRDALLAQLAQASEVIDLRRALKDGPFAKLLADAQETIATYKKKLADLGVDMSQYAVLQASKDEYVDTLADIDLTAGTIPNLRQRETDAWDDIEGHYKVRLHTRTEPDPLSRTPELRR